MQAKDSNKEFSYTGGVYNGFLMLFVTYIVLPALMVILFYFNRDFDNGWVWTAGMAVLIVAFIFCCKGFFVQEPNQARVMIFFGKYRGTCRHTGFFWVNPLMSRVKISLRIRNMDIPPIKVNDKVGNPVLIGMVLVWKVRDTYRAIFDVDSGESSIVGGASSKVLQNFVSIQSDAALREVTGRFAYDSEDAASDHVTLRGGSGVIVELLEEKLNERLAMAGIEVVEARLNYLAYAPEIAAVMLRRQQASAIISAREKIVEGAVSMVKMALDELERENMVKMDDERRAAMVSNLLVVLCADEPAQPVVNTGVAHNA